MTKDEFKKLIDQKRFVEWVESHGDYYGTCKDTIKAIQSRNRVPLLKINVEGTEKFCKAYPESETFFLLPPSIDIFKTRLFKQFANKKEEVEKRVKNAVDEIHFGVHDDNIAYKILNDDMRKAQNVFIRLVECLYNEEIGFSKYANKVPDPKMKFN